MKTYLIYERINMNSFAVNPSWVEKALISPPGVMHVHLAALEDGRGSLVAAAKVLNSRNKARISIGDVDSLVKGAYPFLLRTNE